MTSRIASVILGAGLLTSDCPSTPTPSPPPPGLLEEVEFAGCTAVIIGSADNPEAEARTCEIDGQDHLTLWVKPPEGASLKVAVDAREVAPKDTAMQEGVQLRVPITADSRELVVEAQQGSSTSVFRLSLAPAEVVPELKKAETLRQQLDFEGAKTELDNLILKDTRPGVQAQAYGKLARIYRGKGNSDAAVKNFEIAILLDRQTGRLSDEFLDSFALAFTHFERHRFAEARAALAPLVALGTSHPEGSAVAPYYAATIAFETGDLRATLRLLREAKAGAFRLGLDRQHVDILEFEADVLQNLGRRTEAAALLVDARAALAGTADTCRRADLLTNLGWFLLDAEETDNHAQSLGESGEDAATFFEDATALYRADCKKSALLANVLANLAWARLHQGELHLAETHLREAHIAQLAQPEPNTTLRADQLGIEGSIALLDGQAQRALDFYDGMRGPAESALLRETRWQAELGRARALDMLGNVNDARTAYAEAERVLDDNSFLVPLGEGKATFLGKREESARRRVDFLLRQNSPEAAEAARRSRARVLAAMQWVDRIETFDEALRAGWEDAREVYRSEREELDAEAAEDWKLSTEQLLRVREDRRAREEHLRAALD